MKRKITLLFLLIAMSSSAQTITYSNFSNALSTTLNVKIADLTSFDPALLSVSGTGLTWDASALVQQSGTPVVHLIYGAPGLTPHASLYPGSNYAQYDPALVAFLSYEYFNFSSDSIVKVGSYDPSTEHEVYQDPDKSMIFPFAFGQTFSDDYAKTNYSEEQQSVAFRQEPEMFSSLVMVI